MADLFYNMARLAGRPFRYRITGLGNIEPDCPKVFISNHAGSLGPISIYVSMPVRFHVWVIAEMTDLPRTTDYLYRDFVQPAWHLNGLLGRSVARLLAPLAIGVIRSFSPIAVDRNRGWCREAFLTSNKLLIAGENLLIFPENPARESENQVEIRPFLGGFCYLSHMYTKATGKPLIIQPMAVYPPRRRIILGKPVTLNITNDYRKTMALETHRLQDIVLDLYEKSKNR